MPGMAIHLFWLHLSIPQALVVSKALLGACMGIINLTSSKALCYAELLITTPGANITIPTSVSWIEPIFVAHRRLFGRHLPVHQRSAEVKG